VLLRIPRKRKLLPSYLYLSDVQRTSVYPLAGGGMADVYMGKYFGQDVALKVLHFGRIVVYPNEEVHIPGVGDQGVDFSKLHEVCFDLSCGMFT
jgi:hypothetical protein